MSAEPIAIVMVVEASADARTVAAIVDVVLRDGKTKLEPGEIAEVRSFAAPDTASAGPDVPHITWKECAQRGPRVLGHNRGRPFGHPFAKGAARALKHVALRVKPQVVLLVHDEDNDRLRRDGLEEGRNSGDWPFEVAVGCPVPEREAWILNVLDPESKAVIEKRKELQLDPVRRAHQLRGKPGEPRDIKGVLEELCGKTDEQIHHLEETPLGTLKERGGESGLTHFVAQLEDLLPNLVVGRDLEG